MSEKTIIENFEGLIPFENLIDQCALTKNVIPESLCQEINLAPNETATLIISLKDNHYSIERYIYICSEDPLVTEYTIYGEGDMLLVPTNLMIPTETINTEKIKFYKQWARKKQIKFIIKNKDQYRGFKVWIKGYILYINIEFYSMLNHLIKLVEDQIYQRGTSQWE